MVAVFLDTYLEKVNIYKIKEEYKKTRKQGLDIYGEEYIDDSTFADNFEMRQTGIEALESGNIPPNIIAINRIYFDEISLLWMIVELYKEKAIDGWNILHNYYGELEDMYFAKFY